MSESFIGSVVGNYRVERELGEGGMSTVFVGRTIARSEMLPEGYSVVLKVMSEELAAVDGPADEDGRHSPLAELALDAVVAHDRTDEALTHRFRS